MRRTLALLACLAPTALFAADFTLTILHTNDVHARVEPNKIKQSTYGGYPRNTTLIKQFMKSDPNPILLSAGDVFQGTLYFNVYEGLADLAFMNRLGYTAMVVGNHEFDKGPKAIGNFARLANFPLLAANLDVAAEPELKDWIKPSIVTTVGGQKIGIVGVITPDLPSISSPGPNIRMLDTFQSVQTEVDRLGKEGVDKIILLSHSGYELEQEFAAKIKGVDVVVGGHSHTLLGDLGIADLPAGRGPYPTVVKNADGNTALVVQAWQWGQVLGRIQVTFDDMGAVKDWSKTPPVVVGPEVKDDPEAATMLSAFQKPVAAVSNEVIGATETGLGLDGSARTGENTMANAICDAQLAKTKTMGAVVCFMNAGGVRASMEPGEITYGEAVTVQPFNNTLVLLELTGEEIQKTLEFGSKGAADGSGGLIHLSANSSYTIDASRPEGSRVVKVTIDGLPLDLKKTYKIVLNSFLAGGGDGHEVLKNAKGSRLDTGFLDIEAFAEYIKGHNPLNGKKEGRIVVVGK
ncbi:MAG TPA: bifunctional metallophosphatase/5'-nucleotidase [Fimbriimonadaceae bacterium]|nr:bifunctional metallophosphatase/5'-nucleotidase [Fimbriimonadaceae bacterium]